MTYLKIIGNFIRNSFGSYKRNSIITEFFKEVEEYRTALGQAYTNVLGKKNADKVLELDGYLLSPDSYLFKTSSLRGYTACGFSGRENLLFYVMISPEELDEFKIDSAGKMEGNSKVLSTSPFFFFSPGIIKEHAKELKKASLPPYLPLWIHEYSHFIGYCLQKRPIAVAISILYYELSKASEKGLNHRDVAKLINNQDEMMSEIAKTIIYLQGLDEDMANYLRELILGEMGFDMRDYSKVIQGTFFYPYFKKWGKERFVEYIEDWNEANFAAPEFMKIFLKSLNKIGVERHPRDRLW
jgi:hypothetical protein